MQNKKLINKLSGISMKKIFLTLAVIIGFVAANTAWAELPTFWVSTVAYTSTGSLLIDKTTGATVTVNVKGTGFDYTETHEAIKTDDFGVFSVQVGKGSQTSSDAWSAVVAATTTKISVTYGTVPVLGNVAANVYMSNFTAPGAVSITNASIQPGGASTVLASNSDGNATEWTKIKDANVDGSAAIAGSKISPDFGTQAITTSGNISTTSSGTLTIAGTSTLSGNVDATAGLDVTGADLSVGGTKFTVDDATGDVTLAAAADFIMKDASGTPVTVFSVDGATGNSAIAGTLTVNGDIASGEGALTINDGDGVDFSGATAVRMAGSFNVTGVSTFDGTLKIKETGSEPSHYTILQSGDLGSSDITYTLPVLPTEAGKFLTSGTDGVMSWSEVTASAVTNALTFGDGLATYGETYNGSAAKTVSVLLNGTTLLNDGTGHLGLSLNLAKDNTWTGVQTLPTTATQAAALVASLNGSTSTKSLYADVLKYDATLAVATNALGIDLTHANTWTGAQTFNTATTTIATADINGGTIDGTSIGASTASTGIFTTLEATTYVTTPSLTNTGALAITTTGSGNDISLTANDAIILTGTNGTVTVENTVFDGRSIKLADAVASSGDVAYTTTFTAGEQAANITYTLPAALPTTDGGTKFLTSTTDGGLSWATVAATSTTGKLTPGIGLTSSTGSDVDFNGSTDIIFKVNTGTTLEVVNDTVGLNLATHNYWETTQTFSGSTTGLEVTNGTDLNGVLAVAGDITLDKSSAQTITATNGLTISSTGSTVTVENVKFTGDALESTTSDTDLTLSANGTGKVNINDAMTVANAATMNGATTLNKTLTMGVTVADASGELVAATSSFIKYTLGGTIDATGAGTEDFPAVTEGTIIQLMNSSTSSALTISGLIGNQSTVILQINDMRSFMYTSAGWTLLQ